MQMSESVQMAFQLLAQGMAGIFTVLIVIALIVALLGRLDKGGPKASSGRLPVGGVSSSTRRSASAHETKSRSS